MRQQSMKNNDKQPILPFTDSIILTMQGGRELVVENYQGIIQFDQHLLSLKSKKEQVLIYGDRLLLLYYTQDELKVSGKIRKVEVASFE